MNEIEKKYLHYSRVKEINLEEAEWLLANFELSNKDISDPNEYDRLLELELDLACKVLLGALEEHDFAYRDFMPYERDENGYKIDYFSCIKVKTRDFCIWAEKLKYNLPDTLLNLTRESGGKPAVDGNADEGVMLAITPESIGNFGNGGRPKGYLAEAIEHAYNKFKDEGNTEILREGKIHEFLTRLKELSDEKGNPNFSKYIADRIDHVKKSHAKWVIKTKDKYLEATDSREIKEIGRIYGQQRVSQHLIKLRENNPLPE